MPNHPGSASNDSGKVFASFTKDGVRTLIGNGPPLDVLLEVISGVDIIGINDLQTHQITRAVGSVSHFVRFFDGGEVQLAYNSTGALLDFSFNRVAVRVESDNRVVLERFVEPDSSSSNSSSGPLDVNATEKVRITSSHDIVSVRENDALKISTEGRMKVYLDVLRGIDLRGITDLETHRISYSDNTVSQYLRFLNGGEVFFSFNMKGDLLNFDAYHVIAHAQNGRVRIERLVREDADLLK